MTRFEKMKTMTIDEVVDYVFANTSCQFCIRKNFGGCNELKFGCKHYIKQFFLEEVKKENEHIDS